MPTLDVEKLYIESAKKLRSSLPKFTIFLGMAYIIWVIATTFFLPLANGKFIKSIEASRLESFVVLSSIAILIFFSFLEGRNVADALAGMITAYLVHRKGNVEEMRLRRIRRPLLNIFYLISFSVAFFIFSGVIEQIYPFFNQIIMVLIGIWVVISLILIAMVMGLEIEESARLFAESIERKIKKRITHKSK